MLPARKGGCMLDAVRKYVEAGRDALTPQRAEELARALVREGQVRTDQATRLARDLLDWSRKSSEQLRDSIGREVSRQISRSGLATKEDLEPLKRRIRKLETDLKSLAGRSPARKSPVAKRPSGKASSGSSSGTRTSSSKG
jgi:polyhydroxyalkanoate synthesis regulator phasin